MLTKLCLGLFFVDMPAEQEGSKSRGFKGNRAMMGRVYGTRRLGFWKAQSTKNFMLGLGRWESKFTTSKFIWRQTTVEMVSYAKGGGKDPKGL